MPDRNYNRQGCRTRLTSSLGAEIESAYNPFGDLEDLETGGWQAAFKHDNTGLETERLLPGNIRRRMTHDNLGRVTGQELFRNVTGIDKKEYLRGKNDRLLLVNDNGKERHYEYDKRGYLTRTQYADDRRRYVYRIIRATSTKR